MIIHNYATAPLTYSVALGIGNATTTFDGTGTTILTAAASASSTGVLDLAGGTLQFSAVSQLGGTASAFNVGGGTQTNPTTLAVTGGATFQWAAGYSNADMGNITANRTITLYSDLNLDVNGNSITLTRGTSSYLFFGPGQGGTGNAYRQYTCGSILVTSSIDGGTLILGGVASTAASVSAGIGGWIVQGGCPSRGSFRG